MNSPWRNNVKEQLALCDGRLSLRRPPIKINPEICFTPFVRINTIYRL